MDSTLAGLIGAAIGAAATTGTAVLSERARSRSDREGRLASEERAVRELCAAAYADAVEAVVWLSSNYVEDSVNPRFIERYGPPTTVALERARTAREALKKASALSESPASAVAAEVAVALSALDEAWRSAQEYRKSVDAMTLQQRSSEAGRFYEGQFDRAYARLVAARERLCGFDGTELPHEVTARGGALPGSLLERLRTASSVARP